MSKIKRNLLIAFVGALLLTLAFVKLFYHEGDYQIALTLSGDRDADIELFYANAGEDFSAEKCYSRSFKGGQQELAYDLRDFKDVGQIDGLRIDFGTDEAIYTVKDLRIINDEIVTIIGSDQFLEVFNEQNDIAEVYKKDDAIIIETKATDPYIFARGFNNLFNAIHFSSYYNYVGIGLFFMGAFLVCALLLRMNRKTVDIFEDTIRKYSFLLSQLVASDFKLKYKRSILGVLWSLLNPLLLMTVQYLVFSNLFKVNIDNYVIYLMCGNIVFNFFSESTNLALSAIVDSSGLITKVYIPKYIFPIAKVLSSLINFGFSLLALYFMLLFNQVPVSGAHVFIILDVLYLTAFSIGFGLILCSAMVFFRDIKFLYGIVLTAWMYFTPIFYPESILQGKLLILAKMNPLFHFIRYFRAIVLDAQIPNVKMNLYCLAFSALTLLIGLIVFRKTQDKFILNL